MEEDLYIKLIFLINQRALGVSSFMLRLKFVLISWTC